MNSLISVIINVYNGERFINKCIDSVINQTYKNLEILIVNDGSTDNTLNICKSFKDKRIRIISTSNLGLSRSRNVGIDNTKGEYLYFVDADDFIEPDAIEHLYSICKKYDVKIATTNTLTIFDYNFKYNNAKKKVFLFNSYNMLKKVLLAENCSGTIWNKLIKKELFNKIRFEDRIVNDVVVTYKLVLTVDKIAWSNQIKYFYLKHSKSITAHGYENVDRAVDYYDAIFQRYENVKNIYPNMIENDLSLIRGILRLYIIKNEDIEEFLQQKEVDKQFKKLFSFRMLFANVLFKEKIKLLLFRISPKLYKRIGNLLYRKKYQFKI